MNSIKLFILAIVGVLPFLELQADPLGVERDKVTHLGAAFTGQVLCAAVASEVISKNAANLTCWLVVNGLGAAVEAGAFGENTPEAGDIIANVMGTTAGAVVVEWKF